MNKIFQKKSKTYNARLNVCIRKMFTPLGIKTNKKKIIRNRTKLKNNNFYCKRKTCVNNAKFNI